MNRLMTDNQSQLCVMVNGECQSAFGQAVDHGDLIAIYCETAQILSYISCDDIGFFCYVYKYRDTDSLHSLASDPEYAMDNVDQFPSTNTYLLLSMKQIPKVGKCG